MNNGRFGRRPEVGRHDCGVFGWSEHEKEKVGHLVAMARSRVGYRGSRHGTMSVSQQTAKHGWGCHRRHTYTDVLLVSQLFSCFPR